MHLIVHLRMTGRFLLKKAGEKPIKHERVIFRFKDGTRLAFHDTRRFGTMTVTSQPAVIFQKLGVEPLDPAFSADHLFQLLSRRNKTLKAALLDQTLIAGIGNIYADEALWEAKLHPQQLCQNLTLEHTRRLHAALQMVLRKGIANGGTSLGEGTSNFHHLNGQSGKNQMTLNVYGRKGKPCRRCEKSLQRIIIAQRSTCFCPSCQKISILARSF
jgi:formamidopyrimidine-DNA glycosylase